MGEAKRRAEVLAQAARHEAEHVAKHGPLTEWQQKMKELWVQSRVGLGAFEAWITRPEQTLAMVMSEDRDGLRGLNALGYWREQCDAGKRPLCLACEHEFVPGEPVHAFCCVVPSCEDPTTCLGVGICQECAEHSDEELLKVAYQGMVKMGLANKEKGMMRVGTA